MPSGGPIHHLQVRVNAALHTLLKKLIREESIRSAKRNFVEVDRAVIDLSNHASRQLSLRLFGSQHLLYDLCVQVTADAECVDEDRPILVVLYLKEINNSLGNNLK